MTQKSFNIMLLLEINPMIINPYAIIMLSGES